MGIERRTLLAAAWAAPVVVWAAAAPAVAASTAIPTLTVHTAGRSGGTYYYSYVLGGAIPDAEYSILMARADGSTAGAPWGTAADGTGSAFGFVIVAFGAATEARLLDGAGAVLLTVPVT